MGNNMFAYCNNNPVIFRDSAGTQPVDTIDLDGDGDIDCFVYEYALEYSVIDYINGYVSGCIFNLGIVYFPEKGRIYIFKDVSPDYLADPKNRPDGFRAGIDFMVADCGVPENPNMHVRDSYKCTSSSQRRSIINILLEYSNTYNKDWKRTPESLWVEWEAHNCYAFLSNSAKHADFDLADEGKGSWYFFKKAFEGLWRRIL